MPVERPHIAFPVRRDPKTRKLVVVEQGTDEHILSCENMIVRCPRGFRHEFPEFGWPFPTFQNAPLDLSALKDALRKFEPRGKADVTQHLDAARGAVQLFIGVHAQGESNG